MKKLSDIGTDENIKGGACGIYPGPRCPLALITNVLGEIKGIAALVVGTAECTYYNKNISLMFNKDDEINMTWSYSIDSKEVIFGCRQGVIEALKEIDKTGVEGILAANTLEKKFNIPYLFKRPYGLPATLEWIEEISSILSLKPNDEFVKAERDQIIRNLNMAKVFCRNTTAAIHGF